MWDHKIQGHREFEGGGGWIECCKEVKKDKERKVPIEFGKCLSSGIHNRKPQTGQLKQQTFISHSFEVWEAETRVPAQSGSAKALFLVYRQLLFLCTLTW